MRATFPAITVLLSGLVGLISASPAYQGYDSVEPEPTCGLTTIFITVPASNSVENRQTTTTHTETEVYTRYWTVDEVTSTSSPVSTQYTTIYVTETETETLYVSVISSSASDNLLGTEYGAQSFFDSTISTISVQEASTSTECSTELVTLYNTEVISIGPDEISTVYNSQIFTVTNVHQSHTSQKESEPAGGLGSTSPISGPNESTMSSLADTQTIVTRPTSYVYETITVIPLSALPTPSSSRGSITQTSESEITYVHQIATSPIPSSPGSPLGSSYRSTYTGLGSEGWNSTVYSFVLPTSSASAGNGSGDSNETTAKELVGTSSSVNQRTSSTENGTTTTLPSSKISIASSSFVSTSLNSSAAPVSSEHLVTLVPSNLITLADPFGTTSATSKTENHRSISYSDSTGNNNTGLRTTSVISLTPVTSASSANSASTPSASCGFSGDFALSFDDIPPLAPFSNTSQPEPITSPYHHIWFSSGFVIVPPPTVPYLPSSKPSLLEFSKALSTNGSNTGQVDTGINEVFSCYNFNVYGASLGCNSSGPNCDWQFTAGRYNPVTQRSEEVYTRHITSPACPGLIGCRLIFMTFDAGFLNISFLRINVTVAGHEQTWWMDDLFLGWYDNSCSAGLCRASKV